jgi:transcriptional regulator with XRE-family HTH domain
MKQSKSKLGDARAARQEAEMALYRQAVGMLGKFPDAEIARRTNRSARDIRSMRVALGIPRADAVARLPAPAKEDLGRMTDAALAEKHGLNVSTVRRARVALGVAPARVHTHKKSVEERFPGIVGDLAVMSNANLARKHGVTREYMRQLRKQLGVGTIDRDAEDDRVLGGLLGKEPDRALSARTGIPLNRVIKARQRAGVEAYRYRLSVALEHMALLGTMTDIDLARLSGVGRPTISYLRRSRGIKGFKHVDRSSARTFNHDEVMRLRDEEGLTFAEIASRVGGDASTVGQTYRFRKAALARKQNS